MEDLLPYYERELATLRRHVREFALRNPKIAARLAMSGDRSDDVQVERMLESFALLAARAGARLEDDYPEFTTALIEMLYPQYLRTLPSCSIAQFVPDVSASRLTEAVTIRRGTGLEARAEDCRFRTVYDVVVTPLQLTAARYSQTAVAPASVRLPEQTSGVLSVSFATSAEATFDSLPSVLRVHLAGEPAFASVLLDTLLMRAQAAFIEIDRSGRWKALADVPIAPVGFDRDDALLAHTAASLPAFRLLLEHFAFADKFHFVDLDLGLLARTAGPCRTLTLHLAIAGVPADAPVARSLEALCAEHLKLFCTPVINLFERDAQPVPIHADTTSYPVVPQTTRLHDTEIYSIDSVRMVTQKGGATSSIEVPPYHSLRHDESSQPLTIFWVAHRDRWAEQQRPGHETTISFVGIDAQPAGPGGDQVEIGLTCNNRESTTSLALGAPDGDLLNEDASFACTISLLRAPTQNASPSQRNGALWRLISQITPNHLSLDAAGLKAMLHQHAVAVSTAAARRVNGIMALEYRPAMKWMPVKPLPTFVRGVEVVLTIDEQAFAGASLATFIGVMDRFFAPYAHRNSFVQLVVTSGVDGREIVRCGAREGSTPLI